MSQWKWNGNGSSGSSSLRAETAARAADKVAGAGRGASEHLAPAGPDTRESKRLTEWLHQRLVRQIDPTLIVDEAGGKSRDLVAAAARALMAAEAPNITGELKEETINLVVDEVLGFGPLEPLLRDPNVSEVMVNAPDIVYYERDGKLYESGQHFRDSEHVMHVIERIITPTGRHVDEGSPMVDARLPDGSRVNVVIPPLAPDSPTITIRKFRTDRFGMDDLVKIGSITAEIGAFVGACVRAKVNMLVSGGTGSGKTTLLNILSSFIPESERIVTIEDPLELKLQQRHVVRLEARPSSIEGQGEISQRDLFRNSLRMRPDRIILGEVRGAEAFDMLQAMNTGHEGSLGTLHANSSRDAIARIESMVLLAGFDIPISVIREQISSAVHLIIQMARMPDGSRRLTHITEVLGLEGTVVSLQDIFRYVIDDADEDGTIRGHFEATGVRPRFVDKLQTFGYQVGPETFIAGRRFG